MKSSFLVEGLTTNARVVDLGDLIVSSRTSINLNDIRVRVRGRRPPLKDISHVVKANLSGRRTEIQRGEYGTLPQLLELYFFNGSTTNAFELDSVSTRSFSPSDDFLAESLKSGILLRVDAKYQNSVFMVTALETARTTLPVDSSSGELLEYVVAYRLRKLDASRLGMDPHGRCKDLDDAKNLVLFDEDATSSQFETVDTFTTSAADGLWNIPSSYMSLLFGRDPASFFSASQVWLAQQLLSNKMTRLAFAVAFRKDGTNDRYALQSNLCRLLEMFSLDLSVQCRQENEPEVIAHTVGQDVQSISWIIIMETSRSPLVSRGAFLSRKKASAARKYDEIQTSVESESKSPVSIRRDPRFKTPRGSPNLSLLEFQLAKDFLLKGSAFRQFCDTLRLWVFPVMSEYIESIIGTSLSPVRGMYVVNCNVQWELLQYQREELSGKHTMSEILTITGSPVLAQAASAGDYMLGIWGPEGARLLNAIENDLGQRDCSKFSNVATHDPLMSGH